MRRPAPSKPFMGTVIADLRYAARELRRRPAFAITAVLSLALGIGATSAVFSVIYGVLINPFPYVGSERMMQIALRDSAGRFRYPGMTGDQLAQVRQARSVESAVAEDGWNLTIGGLQPSSGAGSFPRTRPRVRTPRGSWCSAISSGSDITQATRPSLAAPSSSFARTIKSSG